MRVDRIYEKVLCGERLQDEEFLILEEKADIYQLGFLASHIRNRLHPDKTVTYVIDRNINYTDICISACKFCRWVLLKGVSRMARTNVFLSLSRTSAALWIRFRDNPFDMAASVPMEQGSTTIPAYPLDPEEGGAEKSWISNHWETPGSFSGTVPSS